jgi:hypothetical protein
VERNARDPRRSRRRRCTQSRRATPQSMLHATCKALGDRASRAHQHATRRSNTDQLSPRKAGHHQGRRHHPHPRASHHASSSQARYRGRRRRSQSARRCRARVTRRGGNQMGTRATETGRDAGPVLAAETAIERRKARPTETSRDQRRRLTTPLRLMRAVLGSSRRCPVSRTC